MAPAIQPAGRIITPASLRKHANLGGLGGVLRVLTLKPLETLHLYGPPGPVIPLNDELKSLKSHASDLLFLEMARRLKAHENLPALGDPTNIVQQRLQKAGVLSDFSGVNINILDSFSSSLGPDDKRWIMPALSLRNGDDPQTAFPKAVLGRFCRPDLIFELLTNEQLIDKIYTEYRLNHEVLKRLLIGFARMADGEAEADCFKRADFLGAAVRRLESGQTPAFTRKTSIDFLVEAIRELDEQRFGKFLARIGRIICSGDNWQQDLLVLELTDRLFPEDREKRVEVLGNYGAVKATSGVMRTPTVVISDSAE